MTLYLGTEKITPTTTSGGGSGVIASLNVTPKDYAQTIIATGGVDGYSPVNVSAVTSSIDKNITAENIKKDVVILGVTGSYEGSGGSETKFGLGIDSFIGDVSSGTLQAPTLEETDLVFSGVTDLGFNALAYAFYGKGVTSISFPNLVNCSSYQGLGHAFTSCQLLSSVSFPNLTTISGNSAFVEAFGNISSGNKSLSISMPELTTISGQYAMDYVFTSNNDLKSLSLPKLTTIGNYSCRSMCSYCNYLTSVSLPNLTTVGSGGLSNAFASTAITRIDFPKLTSVQVNSFQSEEYGWEKIFNDCYNLTEIHFRADMANVIPTMYGYSSCWGAQNATIYFDLGGTEVTFDITPSQGTTIAVDGNVLSGTTTTLGVDSSHTYTLINSNYPIYYGVITGLVEGVPTTITKDITGTTGHNITINTNVENCTVTFNYNGSTKSGTTLTSTSYESDDIYSESSITVGYTVSKEGYITKSGTIAFNNSDVSINVELKSNDLDLSDYTYTLDENNNAILTAYNGPEVSTLVLPSMEE